MPSRHAVIFFGASTIAAVSAIKIVRAFWGVQRIGKDEIFGEYRVGASQLVLAGQQRLAIAFELNPILPGHVVAAPRRAVGLVEELEGAEYLELWRCVRKAQALVESQHGSINASNLLLKEQFERGGHLHVHIVPRTGASDFSRDDQVAQRNRRVSWVLISS